MVNLIIVAKHTNADRSRLFTLSADGDNASEIK